MHQIPHETLLAPVSLRSRLPGVFPVWIWGLVHMMCTAIVAKSLNSLTDLRPYKAEVGGSIPPPPTTGHVCDVVHGAGARSTP